MRSSWRRSCAGVVDSLLEIDESRAADRSTAAAQRHIEVCDRCRAELTAGLLVQMRLRRLGARLRTLEAPDDAWPRLRARISSEAGAASPDPDDLRPEAATARRAPLTVLARTAGWLAVPLIVAGLLLPPAFDGQAGLDGQTATEASDGSGAASPATGAIIARSRIADLALHDQSSAGTVGDPDATPADPSATGLGDHPPVRTSAGPVGGSAPDPSTWPGSGTALTLHQPITR
jgi:hypothetical protein